MAFATEQEEFWAGEFGNQYVDRNSDAARVVNNVVMFSRVLRSVSKIDSIVEFGPNVGLNLQALHNLLPSASLTAVEVNAKAAEKLSSLGFVDVIHDSFLEYSVNRTFDLVLTKGVLIHINPDHLANCYDKMYQASARYICIAEYYSPNPVEIPYRGHQHKLFKRDFAGEIMARHKDLELIDHGFVYHGDKFPQDDTTWFLLRKPA